MYIYIDLRFILSFIHGVRSVPPPSKVRGRVKASDWWMNSITHQAGSTSRSSSLRSRGILYCLTLQPQGCAILQNWVSIRYQLNTGPVLPLPIPHNLWSECIINMKIWMKIENLNFHDHWMILWFFLKLIVHDYDHNKTQDKEFC